MRLSEDLQQAILDEGRAYAPGTIRTWKGGKFIKTARGEWEPVQGDADRASKRQEYVAKTKATVGEFKAAVAGGKFGNRTLGQHLKIAKDFQSKHDGNLTRFKGDLSAIAGPGASVKARTKTLESMIGKMLRKPKYQSADQLQDGTGARIVHQTIDQVKRTVDKIKAKYKVVAEDDYISKPHPDDPTYRSHHLVIEDEDGLQKEVQIRTGNQNKFADWSHNVYKPRTPAESRAVDKNKDVISEYAKGMSDYFFRKDSGEAVGSPPDCPGAVKASVGCID